jgi:hypothetical protein
VCAKKRFDTPRLAKRSLRTLQKRTRKSEFNDAHIYRCLECRAFHIGHRW